MKKRIIIYSLIALLITGATIGGYILLHNIATAHRGYEAIGGEIAVFAVPFLIIALCKNKKDTENIFKK